MKLSFPNFSLFHAESLAMAVGWLGLSAGPVMPLDQSQLDQGLLYTSGRECLPLPICIGQLLRIHENRGPGEIAGLFVPQGGAPCVIDAYQGYLERFLAEQRLPDLFLFYPGAENDYCGIDKYKLAGHISSAVLVADILVEIEQSLRVVGAPGSGERLGAEWERFVARARSLDQFHAVLAGFVARLAALPRTCDPTACPRVLVTGGFFTRFSTFFMKGVASLYADKISSSDQTPIGRRRRFFRFLLDYGRQFWSTRVIACRSRGYSRGGRSSSEKSRLRSPCHGSEALKAATDR